MRPLSWVSGHLHLSHGLRQWGASMPLWSDRGDCVGSRGGCGGGDGLPGGPGGGVPGVAVGGLPGEAGGLGAAWRWHWRPGRRALPPFSTGFGDPLFPRASQSFPSGVMFGRWLRSWVGISVLGMTRVLKVSTAPAAARRWPGVLPVLGCPSSRGLGPWTRPGRACSRTTACRGAVGRREAWKPCPGRGGSFLPPWGADDPGPERRGASLGRRSGGDGRDPGGTGGPRARCPAVRGN